MKAKDKLQKIFSFFHIKQIEKPSEKKAINIGITIENETMHACWFDSQGEMQFMTTSLLEIATLANKISHHCLSHRDKQPIRWIYSIPAHQLWQTTLIIDSVLDEYGAFEQASLVLAQRLPLPIDDVWFDYSYSSLNNSQSKNIGKLEIIAIRKEYVEAILSALQPIQVSVIDNMLYSMLRAFYYLCPTKMNSKNTIWVYQHHNQLFWIQDHWQEIRLWLHLSNTEESFNVIYHKFLARYTEQFEQIIIVGHLPNVMLVDMPLPYEIIPLDKINLVALGNALWDHEFNSPDILQ